MKKRLFVMMTVGLVLFFLLVAATPAPALRMMPVKLRFATVLPPPDQSLASYGVKLWMDEITEKTRGVVTFKTVWGDTLESPAEQMARLEKGDLDLVLTHRWLAPEKFPLGQFESVFRFGPVDPVIVTKAKRQIYEEFPGFR